MGLKNLDIVKRIKAARIQAGLTQKELAKNLGRTSAAISDLERGKVQVSAIDVFKLSKLLKKPIEYFFGEEFGDIDTQELIAGIRDIEPEDRFAIVPIFRNILRMQAIGRELRVTTDQQKGMKLFQELFGIIQMINRQFKAMTEEGDDLEQQLKEIMPTLDFTSPTKTKKD